MTEVRVLIAGCGDLGTEVGLRLLATGHQVAGLRRDARVLPPSFERIDGRLPTALPALPGDVDAVVYAASPDERTPEAYRTAFLAGPRGLLDALEAAGSTPARMVLVSSTAVYGVDDGSWVDETTPTEPRTPTGAVLVEAEQALWERLPDAIVLRLAGIYGPGRTSLIDRLRTGRALRPDPPHHANRIHRDDAAQAIVHLLTLEQDVQRCYLGVDHAPVELGEVLDFLADELGLDRPPAGPVPPRGGDKRCRNDRLIATGLELVHPTYVEGYRAVLAGRGTRHP